MSDSLPSVTTEREWAAFAAIDWADQKHFWRLVPAGSQNAEHGALDNTPEAVEVWAVALQQRFGGRPIALCLTRVIRNACVSVRAWIKPDFVAAGCLPVELEAARLQFADYLPVSESCQAAHLRGDHNRVVSPLRSGRQIRNAVALASSFDQLTRDIARYVKCFGDRSPLRDQAGKLFRSCKEWTFWQLFNLNVNRQFHTNRW